MLSNKGYGSSCFFLFAPLVSYLLPSSSTPRTPTHLTLKPSFPLPRFQSRAVSLSLVAYFPDGISNPIILLPEGHAPISRDFFLLPFRCWIQESTQEPKPSLPNVRIGCLSGPSSVPLLLALDCPRRLRNISRGPVLWKFCISEQECAQRTRDAVKERFFLWKNHGAERGRGRALLTVGSDGRQRRIPNRDDLNGLRRHSVSSVERPGPSSGLACSSPSQGF